MYFQQLTDLIKGLMNFALMGNATASVSIVTILSVVVILIIGCTYVKTGRDDEPSDEFFRDLDAENPGGVDNNLVPPVFFTQGLKDPIYQDDLMDNVKQAGVTTP